MSRLGCGPDDNTVHFWEGLRVSGWRFIICSLWHHRRINLAVALGVAAATAVLTGALLVGDSVRGSLRRLTLDRLGRIDEVLVAQHFFRGELARELAEQDEFGEYFSEVIPAVLFPQATVERTASDRPRARASQVTLLGSPPTFWDAGTSGVRPQTLPGNSEIVLNAALARDLDARVGDELVLRLPKANQVPADSALGRKTDRIRSVSGLKVVAIVPAEGLGRFSLQASQTTPRNAFVALATLQDALDQPGQINALLVTGKSGTTPPEPVAEKALENALQPSLADYGLDLRRVRRTFHPPGESQAEEVVFDFFDLSSRRMLFSPAAQQAVEQAWKAEHPQAVFTYLATTLAKAGDHADVAIPYSLVTASDAGAPIGPLADDEIALNRWAAEDLQAVPNDRIRVTFFEPETTHGELRERTAEFTLKTIVPFTEPSKPNRRNVPAVFTQRPTVANDPDLTPTVAGVTDQDSIAKWNAPFPVDSRRIRRQDDTYWANHRTTPKAFISLAAGRKLWGSRFGQTTSFRVPVQPGLTPGSIAERERLAELREQLVFKNRVSTQQGKDTRLLGHLAPLRAELGLVFVPVKQRGLAASNGATPFDVLFLFLSFFIIAAALLLVSLLFRLGLERRAQEIGTLLAVGLRPNLTRRWLISEGLLVAAAGGVIGCGIGTGYAWLMLAGLQTWWSGAVQASSLWLDVPPTSLLIGYLSGVLISGLTIIWSLRGLQRVPVRRLLAGQTQDAPAAGVRRSSVWAVGIPVALFASSLGLTLAATRLGGEAQAGAFVGSGVCVLLALLLLIRSAVRTGGSAVRPAYLGLMLMAFKNAGRHPGRSTMTIALMAVACFLIVAMSAFRQTPTASGTGGFALLGETSEPVFGNLNQSSVRQELLAEDADRLAESAVIGLRVQTGDDASCSNLYQASQPRVLGVTEELIRHFDRPEGPAFAWAATAASTPEERANPWRLLSGSRTAAADRETASNAPSSQGDAPASEPVVAVVLDKNTAMYSLHLYQGVGETFSITFSDGQKIRFRVAGLLANSILQGSLLIGEADFVRCFPMVSGYRYFLVEAPPAAVSQVAEALNSRLSDQGFAAVSAAERLQELLDVQNTYLSAFQSLGALGLLLGTLGLAAVQARNILDRRRELALLRALGFLPSRLLRLVLWENIGLLLSGLLTGCLAALFAVLPHLAWGGAAVPFRDLSWMLGVVLGVGLLASLVMARATLQAPVLAALRGE